MEGYLLNRATLYWLTAGWCFDSQGAGADIVAEQAGKLLGSLEAAAGTVVAGQGWVALW